MTRRAGYRICWLLAALIWLPGWVSAEASGSRGVEQLHELLVNAMQTPGQQEREALLQDHLLQLFDVNSIARISLGRTWRTLDDTRRTEFVTLLGELIVATYADRFDSFDQQSFVTDEVKTVKSGAVVVTRLLRRNGEAVTLDYYLRNDRVFNVVADGVSDLSLRRADYNSIIKNEGYESLLGHIRSKLAEARGTVAENGGL